MDTQMLSSYIVDYIETEVSRGETISTEMIEDALDAFVSTTGRTITIGDDILE